MRVRQLHINRFGHFQECDLDLASDGLQVIFGPNEAGKTTLLEFLRGVLFDFPSRTPYDFGGPGDVAGVASLELADGRTIELRRRKGNKNKVSIKVDGQPTGYDDSAWLRMLDHADRNLFESVFAFGLAELSRGEESLKHESLQSVLFGGGLGGTNSPDKVIADLTRQADELFTKTGSKRTINALLTEIRNLGKEIKSHLLRPQEYHEIEAKAGKAVKSAQALHQQVDELRRRHARVEGLVRACPKWWDLQHRLDARTAVIVPPKFPRDMRQRYLDACKEQITLDGQHAKLKVLLEQTEAKLTGLKLDPTAVSYRAETKSCLELRQSFIDAKRDLPERQQERERTRRLIDRELKELRPGWSHDDLRAFTVDLATHNEIDRLSEDERKRLASHTKLTALRDVDFSNLAVANDTLAEIDSTGDISALVAVLTGEADYAANRKRLASAQSELLKLDRKFTSQLRKLSPPLPVENLTPDEVPVPRVEIITEFKTRFNDLREQLRAENISLRDDEAERGNIEKLLTATTSQQHIPSLQERDVARQRRDCGWELVRRKYVLGESIDSSIDSWLNGGHSSMPEEYERAVRDADGIADRIYEHASDVAKRENLSRQLTELTKRLSQKFESRSILEGRQADLQREWISLWQQCGFEPLVPDAMLAWLSDHETICAIVSQKIELQDELSLLSERIASFEQRLRTTSDCADEEIAIVLASAKKLVEETQEKQRTAVESRKTIRHLEKQIQTFDGQLVDLAAQDTAARSAWQRLLARLTLPPDWGIEVARQAIDKLSATRVRLDSLPGDDSRIAAMLSRVEEFGRRVRALCDVLSSDLSGDPPELALQKLAEYTEQAVETQRKHRELSAKMIETRYDLDRVLELRQKSDVQRAEMFALADAQDESGFLNIVGRAEKAAQLDHEVQQLQRDLELIRAGHDKHDFEQTLAMSELSVLEGEARDVCEQLNVAELARKVADGEEAVARNAWEALDGSSEVAELSEELSRKRALLAAEIDRYMPIVYARHILNNAVSRFEKENQPEMIATVSTLIRQMTSGKYVEFDRMGSGKHDLIIRRSDGAERTPGQLSTGTREQLYLAIRLAYVLHYCKQNESLPIIVDDVLVNFDDIRLRQTLATLAGISNSVQVMLFTCHQHTVDIAREVVPSLVPIELSGTVEG